MVGGSEPDFEKAKTILSLMGKNVIHCGAISTGQAAKICNNMMLAISMTGTSEAIHLGIRLAHADKIIFHTCIEDSWLYIWITKVCLSCYLVLLSNDSKTRKQDRPTFVTWPKCTETRVIIGSCNGLSPDHCQAITWTNANLLLIKLFRLMVV